MKLRVSEVPDKVFWVCLFFCTLFVSYRYPLKLGTTDTSPTYSDTPVYLQTAKFVGVLCLAMLSSWWALKARIKAKSVPLLILLIFLQCIVLAKAFYAFDVRYIDQTFWPLAALVLCLSIRQVETTSLDAFLKFLLLFSVASDAVEVFLFVTTGRLPAQGYADSIAIRFGGWLDSPNDFACILFLLMAWALFRYRGFKRCLIQVMLLLCLILTQSLTAYAFYVASLILLAAIHVLTRPRSSVWIGLLFGIVTLAALSWLPDLFSTLLENKATSISGHLRMPADLLGDWESWVWLGASSYEFYENWWVSSLFNLGVPWLIVCVITTVWLLSRVGLAFRKTTSDLDKALLAGIFALASYCVLGSWSFPVLTFFPVNFMFYLFCFLVSFGKLQFTGSDPLVGKPVPLAGLRNSPSPHSVVYSR